ncbi:NAD-dependent epimerase/dehydratase family protein [Rhodohalobacter sp. 614A]|uniref:NAD-dependent epimerase/dehydratase family protein n=1 Tax=Rhodohalobacter sp. 614A TaxID=2908649 RepID=UPI001F1B1107|nr:NAD(P)-dependent oxidoreductase [Rhodohalobacter sp. 614A]
MSKKLNVLVTGGAGFLGSHISDELSDRGHNVTITDLEESKWIRDDQEMAVGDITDNDFLEQVMEGKDVVYHLAALADLNAAKTRPVETAKINVLGTVNLLDMAVKKGVKRVVFASSVYVYSREGGFYRCSKQACENYIEEFNNIYDLDYTILRYGSLYGPRTDESNGVYRLLKQAMEQSEVQHRGAPEDKREYIHVLDAAKLSVDILDDEFKNTHVVITGNDVLRIEDLFYMFSEILGKNIHQTYIEGEEWDGHYRVTPYTFTPKTGKKLTTPHYVDMGQGILQVIEDIYRKINSAKGKKN